MKRLFGFLGMAALVMLVMSSMPACDDDDDDNPATPTTGSIAGTVNFAGTWPATGQVQVSVFQNFPPTGAPDAFTDPLDETTTYNYRFDGLDPATYAAVVVGWLDPNLPPGQEKILGFYWAYVDSVAVDNTGTPRGVPLPVAVEAGETADNIDMAGDLDVAP
jgi:hypothetical protein